MVRMNLQSSTYIKPARFKSRARAFSLYFLLPVLLIFGVSTGVLTCIDDRQKQRIRSEYRHLSEGGQFIDLDGLSLFFRETIPEDPSDQMNLPLVLIHGLMGSSQDFAHVQPDLARHRPVIAVDLPPFGQSDQSVDLDYSKKALAGYVASLMTELGYDRYAVLGHSMGGEVAQHMALDPGSRVSRLLLLDSAGSVDPRRRMSVPPFVVDLIFKNHTVQRSVFRRSLFNPDTYMPEAFESLFYFSHQIPAAALSAFIDDDDSGETRTRLGDIRQPTIILWGREDKIIPVEEGYTLQDAIPESRLLIFEECGHLPYLEKPDELTCQIQLFLSEDAEAENTE